MPLLKQLKNKVTTLESNKVIKDFGMITFKGVANQKVKIQIPITGTLNINKLIVRILSNYNSANFAGVLEKTVSFVTNTSALFSKSEEYTCIGNNTATAFAVGELSKVDSNIEIPIAFLNSVSTQAKIMIEGYYFNATTKTALESAILSEIYTTDTTVFEKPTLSQNITTGTEYETGRVIDGKKEYAKRISIGTMPNATEKEVAHGLDMTKIVVNDIRGVMQAGSGYAMSFPFLNSSNQNVYFEIRPTVIRVTTTTDRSAYTGHVTIYYTKN